MEEYLTALRTLVEYCNLPAGLLVRLLMSRLVDGMCVEDDPAGTPIYGGPHSWTNRRHHASQRIHEEGKRLEEPPRRLKEA